MVRTYILSITHFLRNPSDSVQKSCILREETKAENEITRELKAYFHQQLLHIHNILVWMQKRSFVYLRSTGAMYGGTCKWILKNKILSILHTCNFHVSGYLLYLSVHIGRYVILLLSPIWNTNPSIFIFRVDLTFRKYSVMCEFIYK